MRRSICAAACGLTLAGCLMSGNYHTAKTLEKGESQFGVTFSGTTYEKTVMNSDGSTSRLNATIPNVIPEFTFHVGAADNLEAGGRVSIGALGLEGDIKYRFYHGDKLHLAIAPAIGGQAFILIEGAYVRLPVILTYELADSVDFTIAGFGASSHYNSVDSDFGEFQGTLLSSGAAVGFDLHGETFSIRPAVEFTRYLYNFSDSSGNSTSSGFNTVNFLVHIAWTGGREKKQLDRIEQKIDRMNGYPPPVYPAPTYPPPTYPAPSPTYPPPPPAPPPAPPPTTAPPGPP